MQILGVPVNRVTMDEAVNCVEAFIADRRRPHLVVTANSEMVMRANEDPLLAHIMQRADLVVPDGIGVVWASRLLGEPLGSRVPGIELMHNLLSRSAERGWNVFLLGAEPGVAERAASNMQQAFPGLSIVGCRHGYFHRRDEEEIVAALQASSADILFLALGVPRQEKWAAAHLGRLNIPLAMGVGGSFNVWAGLERRAPQWMQKAGMEWLYRLLKQPARWRRMAVLPQFVLLVLWTKLQSAVSRSGT